jgi:DNA-binding response OmpR family regulator
MSATLRVLLFDDEPLVQETIALMLSRYGFDVVTGRSGRDGLRQIAEVGYDVLVTDLLMPDVDGIELLRAAREARPGVPIVCISGGGPRLTADFGLKLLPGFEVRILAKPFGGEALAAAIRAAFADRPPPAPAKQSLL